MGSLFLYYQIMWSASSKEHLKSLTLVIFENKIGFHLSYWWDKSNSLRGFPWASSCSYTMILFQWQSSVVTGCKTLKIKCKINQERMFEKALHWEGEKELNTVCNSSEALQGGKNSCLALEKYRNEVPLNEWSSQKVWSGKKRDFFFKNISLCFCQEPSIAVII